MNIQKNDILELSDNVRYLVVSKVIYEDNEYFYLVNIVDNSNIKLLKYENNELISIDNNILDKLLKLFVMDLNKSLSSEWVYLAKKVMIF